MQRPEEGARSLGTVAAAGYVPQSGWGSEPEFSARAVSELNCPVVCSVPYVKFLESIWRHS